MSVPQSQIPTSALKILVVKSEERTKKLMTVILKRYGWTVGRLYARKDEAVFIIREAYFLIKQQAENDDNT